MAMSKKDFIALADNIRKANAIGAGFSADQIEHIADFCKSQNSAFMRDRWIGYINGENGSSGGAIKAAKVRA